MLLFVIVLSIPACRGGKKGDGKQYNLSASILKGPAFSNLVNSIVKMEFTIMGMKTSVDMDIRSDLRFTILPDSAGLKMMQMTFDDVQVNIESPLMSLLGGKNEKKNLDNGFGKVKGASFILGINNKGVLQEAKPVPRADMPADSLAGNDNLNQPQGREELQAMLGAMFAYFTPNPVQVGDSWTSESTTSISQMRSGIKNKYTLVNVQDNIAEIKVEGDITALNEMGKEALKFAQNIEGKQKGFMKINLATGQVTSSKISMNMEGEIKSEKMNSPMKAEMESTYKSK